MTGPLEGLRDEERFACLVAERVTGGWAEAWDVGKRQGAVDAMLHLPDRRTAAFEVMAHDEDYGIQLDRLLGADDLHWPAVGKWWWTIQVGSRSDVPRLRECYGHIVELCEATGVERPQQLWSRHLDVDADIAWLVEESNSTMSGHPNVAAVDGDIVRDVMVVPAGRGGGVDTSLAGLHAALVEMFDRPGVAKHLRKVAQEEIQALREDAMRLAARLPGPGRGFGLPLVACTCQACAAPGAIGERVAAHRRRRGISQAALAGLVGRSESWLSQVERGIRSV